MVHKKTNNDPQKDKQWSTKRQTMVHKKTNNDPQKDKPALTQLVPPVHQELLILPGLLHSPWFFVEFVLLYVFCVAFCGPLFVYL
jgi:hypothetical protein